METCITQRHRCKFPVELPALPIDEKLAFIEHVCGLLCESRFGHREAEPWLVRQAAAAIEATGTNSGFYSQSTANLLDFGANGSRSHETPSCGCLCFLGRTPFHTRSNHEGMFLSFQPNFVPPEDDAPKFFSPDAAESLIASRCWDASEPVPDAQNPNLKSASCRIRGSPGLPFGL
jgi:hypothetical protein